MHYFQISKVWHKLTQGLWLAEGLIIKALPQYVEDPGSNLICWIQTRNLNPSLSHPHQILQCFGLGSQPFLYQGIHIYAEQSNTNSKYFHRFIPSLLYANVACWRAYKIWIKACTQHIEGWDSIQLPKYGALMPFQIPCHETSFPQI